MNPLVSIIIPVYNSEKTIRRCLERVLAQSYAPVEIIVADDGSSDRSPDIIRSFSGVRYFRQENSGPASARNLGAQKSSGDFLFFTDSDCIPHADWIERAMPRFQDQSVAVVAGSYGIANPEYWLAVCVHQEILFRHQTLLPTYPRAFGSYNFGIRRRVFNDVGGFDPTFRYASGEDNELSYKILKAGFRIYFERDALVDHYHPASVLKYLRDQSRHGYWRAKLYRRHQDMIVGDDYTFWKDIIEVPASVVTVILGFASFIGLHAGIFWGAVFLFWIFQVYFAAQFHLSWQSMFYYAAVLICRSLARTAGLIQGTLSLLIKN